MIPAAVDSIEAAPPLRCTSCPATAPRRAWNQLHAWGWRSKRDAIGPEGRELRHTCPACVAAAVGLTPATLAEVERVDDRPTRCRATMAEQIRANLWSYYKHESPGGRITLSLETMAKRNGCSIRTVQRGLRVLEEAGRLWTVYKPRGPNSMGIYFVEASKRWPCAGPFGLPVHPEDVDGEALILLGRGDMQDTPSADHSSLKAESDNNDPSWEAHRELSGPSPAHAGDVAGGEASAPAPAKDARPPAPLSGGADRVVEYIARLAIVALSCAASDPTNPPDPPKGGQAEAESKSRAPRAVRRATIARERAERRARARGVVFVPRFVYRAAWGLWRVLYAWRYPHRRYNDGPTELCAVFDPNGMRGIVARFWREGLPPLVFARRLAWFFRSYLATGGHNGELKRQGHPLWLASVYAFELPIEVPATWPRPGWNAPANDARPGSADAGAELVQQLAAIWSPPAPAPKPARDVDAEIAAALAVSDIRDGRELGSADRQIPAEIGAARAPRGSRKTRKRGAARAAIARAADRSSRRPFRILDAAGEGPALVRECAEHNDADGSPCPACGYQRAPLPSWVTFGARFGLDGLGWRVMSIGTTNAFGDGRHTAEQAQAERVDGDAWELPAAPCSVETLGHALAQLRALRRFTAAELARALYVAGD